MCVGIYYEDFFQSQGFSRMITVISARSLQA